MKKEMKNPVSDEKEDKKGNISWRVVRGGSWSISSSNTIVTERNIYAPTNRFSDMGFRIVRNKK